jgi:hypothetical protein
LEPEENIRNIEVQNRGFRTRFEPDISRVAVALSTRLKKLFYYFIIVISVEISTESLPTYLISYGAETFLRSCQLCSYSRNSQHFMGTECSLPCSKEPSTGPYPEPD